MMAATYSRVPSSAHASLSSSSATSSSPTRATLSPRLSSDSHDSERKISHFRPWNILRMFYRDMRASFASLKHSPRELYVNFFLHFCDSYSYFALSQILVLYLHNNFGASDLEAGAAYGMWGASITFWGFVMGCFNDRLGIRRSLLTGFSISLLANFIIAVTTSKNVVLFVLFCLLPIGNCMGIPMLTVGVKRFTNKLNRGFAFGLYYSVMNIAALLSGPVVDFFNIAIAGSNSKSYWSGNRLVVVSVVCSNLISLLVTYFFMRDIPQQELLSDSDDEEEGINSRVVINFDRISSAEDPNIDVEVTHNFISEKKHTHTDSPDTNLSFQPMRVSAEEPDISGNSAVTISGQISDHNRHNNSDNNDRSHGSHSLPSIVSELLCSPTFWRFCVFTLFLINLKMIFRHLDATLPTYLMRCFGNNYPKGLIYAINPFMIIWLTPVVAAMTSKWPHYEMIKYGGYFSALSPFFLAMSTSTWSVVMFMVFLSLGEAIWSPRLYDYTMSIAPQGREATFSALAAAPLFAAKIPVGLLSGYLLSRYLPEDNSGVSQKERQHQGQILWLIIGLLTISSPILITVCEPCIREPDETFSVCRKPQEKNGNTINYEDVMVIRNVLHNTTAIDHEETDEIRRTSIRKDVENDDGLEMTTIAL